MMCVVPRRTCNGINGPVGDVSIKGADPQGQPSSTAAACGHGWCCSACRLRLRCCRLLFYLGDSCCCEHARKVAKLFTLLLAGPNLVRRLPF